MYSISFMNIFIGYIHAEPLSVHRHVENLRLKADSLQEHVHVGGTVQLY